MRREAGYSTELGYLRDALTSDMDEFDYTKFHRYLKDTDPVTAEHMDPEKAYKVFNDLGPLDVNKYNSWLVEQNLRSCYNDPIYTAMDWRKFSRPEWNVHFTEEADAIGANGFQYGHPELHGLHATTQQPDGDRKRQPGYNFAFPADAVDAQYAEEDGSYGNDAVLFYGGGADTYHRSDNEVQRLFWGKNVDPRMIFPIKRDSNGQWYVEDATGRILVNGKNYGDVVQWVKTNYRTLQSIREKQRRKLTHE